MNKDYLCPKCKGLIKIIKYIDWDNFNIYYYPRCISCHWTSQPVFNTTQQALNYLEDINNERD